MPRPLALTTEEIATAFTDAKVAVQFPPVLSIKMAAELFLVSERTMKLYIAQGLLTGATAKFGKHRRIWRDRAIQIMFARGYTSARQSKTTPSNT